MTTTPEPSPPAPSLGSPVGLERHAPRWLAAMGVRSWLLLGVLAFAAVVLWSIQFTAMLVVPATIAIVTALLTVPLVDRLAAWQVPRPLGALAVLLLVAGVLVLTVVLTITGITSQADTIRSQVEAGLKQVTDGLVAAGIGDLEVPTNLSDLPLDAAVSVLGGVSGAVAGVGAGVFGLFIVTVLLYFALVDWRSFERWTAKRLGVPESTGERIVSVAVHDVRLYFMGLTISALVVVAMIAATMWILAVPLIVPVALVTFVTSYIPYVGAIVSGIFVVFVALGSQGVVAAAILLAVVVVSQNAVQALVQARISSGGLELHPAQFFAVTILGTIVAGAIGAILAAPVIATLLKVRRYVTGNAAA